MDYRMGCEERFEQFLLDNEVCTEDELALVTCIAGRRIDTYESILYARCGLRSLEQAAEENFIMDSVLQDLDKSMLSDSKLDELGLLDDEDDDENEEEGDADIKEAILSLNK